MLYLTEPIDEPAINNIGEFNEFKFVDVTREGLDLGDIPEEEKKKVTGHILLFSQLFHSCAPGMTCSDDIADALHLLLALWYQCSYQMRHSDVSSVRLYRQGPLACTLGLHCI